MGIWDFVKSELIDVIEWLDDTGDTIVWRFPDQDHEIKMGAKLTVREGQTAVFVNEGRIADVFKPGLYTLSTQNLPVLTTLRSWKYGFESPFKAEVYFVNTRNFLDLKWGTQNPVMMRDPEFGVVRLRAFGTYGIRVVDAAKFLREVVGTDGNFTAEEIEGQLRSMVVSTFASVTGASGIAALDLAANYRKMGDTIREQMEPEFQRYGISLVRLVLESISVPPEVEKVLDTRTQMGIVGDMGRYMQFQTAQAVPEAARAGGGAGDFMGMGAGVVMGQQMAAAMSASMARPQEASRPSAGPFCGQCGKPVPAGAKFCPECGSAVQSKCPKCGTANAAGAKFCQDCGQKLV
ncbi:MAG: SPFH domain-containing protein [Desulfomonile sp.]|nr:SPFH domain-containing protein [Desulfomonile sp.]